MKLIEYTKRSEQVVWLDDLSRNLLDSGTFEELRDDAGVGGVTANPTIYDEAISDGDSYTDAIKAGADAGLSDAEAIFWDLAVADVRRAADLLRARYDATDGSDGLVSLELSPVLANDAEATVDAGRELFARLDRPNVMVKVPGTEAGATAIEELTAAGVNVNVTLLFGLHQFEASWTAYVNGLYRRLTEGESVERIHSVASFFLSRIDVKANDMLPATRRNELAVAMARLALDRWLTNQTLNERWAELAHAGAAAQRLLWASTSSKDPALSPTFYPDRLIAPDTVITVPQDTLEAMRQTAYSGGPRLDQSDIVEAEHVVETAKGDGIDPAELAAELQIEGVEKFSDSWNSLLGTIAATTETVTTTQ